MTAMILAGGKGTRMRPLTDTTPKPLLKVHGKPLIEWHIEKLAHAGFQTIIINIAYLGYQIPQALGDGRKWAVEIIYSDEQQEGALESAGGIIKALPYLSETFLVINGDVWSDYPFTKEKNLNNQLAHLILVPNPEHNPTGDFQYQGDYYTFSGIGYYRADAFKEYQPKKLPLAPILRKMIEHDQVSFELHQGIWHDIGTPERLEQVNSRVAPFIKTTL
jgi:MurNAc alpha-1-phosphate uridylyltransferase